MSRNVNSQEIETIKERNFNSINLMPDDDAQVRSVARPYNFDSTRLSQVSSQIIILWILVV